MSDSVQPHRRQPTTLPHPWDSPGKNTGVGCRFLLQCMKLKSEREAAQSFPTLSDPVVCSLPGSSVHGIFQARVLEWGAIAFSEESLRDLVKTRDFRLCISKQIAPLPALIFLSCYLFSTEKPEGAWARLHHYSGQNPNCFPSFDRREWSPILWTLTVKYGGLPFPPLFLAPYVQPPWHLCCSLKILHQGLGTCHLCTLECFSLTFTFFKSLLSHLSPSLNLYL